MSGLVDYCELDRSEINIDQKHMGYQLGITYKNFYFSFTHANNFIQDNIKMQDPTFNE